MALDETWYFRDAAGAACGPGTRRNLSETKGTSVKEQTIEFEHTWNRTEATARGIKSGNWSVGADLSTGFGSGATVRCVVERRNSSCVVQETILNDTVVVPGSQSPTSYWFTADAVGQIDFAVDDILTVRLRRVSGISEVKVHYDGAASTEDSRLKHPGEAASVSAASRHSPRGTTRGLGRCVR